jgi:hypothetical protein
MTSDRLRRQLAVALALGPLLAGCTSSGSTEPGPGPSSRSSPADPASTAAPARVLEVAPDGDDEATGAPGDPFETLDHALGELEAGDELVVRGGEYRESVNVEAREGTREAPVRVRAAPGERPVVRGLLWLEQPTWWDVRGLDVRWDTRNDSELHMVKVTGGDDWVLGDAELSDARGFAALLVNGEPSRFLLTGLYVHDTRESNDTNQDHLVYLNCGTGGGVLERSLLVGSPNGRAVKVGPADSGGDPIAAITIRYNTMVDNEGPSNVQLSGDTSEIVIERNIMDGAGEGRASVTAFELEGDDNVVRDNVSWRSAGTLEADQDGLEDGGGNTVLDPDLQAGSDERPYEPREPKARDYGRWAP